MGGDRRARRQERARNFGRRHPILTIAIVGALMAVVVLICVAQLIYGAYLGPGWLAAALAGITAAAGFGVVATVSRRRRDSLSDRVVLVWAVVGAMSISAIRLPFPHGHYDSVQAAFNVVHAAALGFEAVTIGALLALIIYLAVRSRGRTRGQGQALPRGRAPRRATLPARLRFPAAQAANWRAGHLTAKDDTVTWRSLKGDLEVDLTSACQALAARPADGRGRQPRVTTLATDRGLADVDVGPRALAELVRKSSPSALR